MEHVRFDIFISYKRKSLAAANNLYYRLTTRGYSTFFDLEEMRRDNFNDQLLDYIKNAKDVFVVLEEGSLDACRKEGWEKDWFCYEISYALEQKKNIIPILIGWYTMPPEDFFPDKLKALHFKEGPEFNFSFFEAYLDKLIKNDFLNSKPNILDKASSVFKFYSDEQCHVFKEGKLVCSLEEMSDEPYYLPVSRKGDYRFKVVNIATKETIILNEHIDLNEEKNIEVKWKLIKTNNTSLPDCPTTQKVEDDKNLDFVVNGISFKMIQVQGGTFKMGAQSKDPNADNYNADADNNESPIHNVILNDYFIGETVVTQSLWKAVMGTNPSFCKGDNFPVEQVSWSDCQKFIQNLNALTGETFHLPTEAEWEYAARGGKNSRGYKFAGGNSIGDVAWYRDNYADIAHPVRTKCPNELGLYDMSGSVCEWCDDGFENYSSSDQNNPRCALFASEHVLRGGSRISSARNCRVTNRELSTDSPNRYIGFRLTLKKNTDENGKTLKVGDVEFKMIHVQGGNFLMGAQKEDTEGVNYDNDAYTDESPVHEVTLDEYYIGETEVTQALWKEVMGSEPTRDGGWTEELGRGNNYPVYWVSWNDCQEFIRKLNAKTGKAFRLPIEAEWEYAARGGNLHQDNKYAGGNVIDDVAWYADNSVNKTHPVKEKWPNELGLYDMSGNVWEWCQDWFSQSYYGESLSYNPVCQSGGLTRVLRGGSFNDFPRGCRVTVRGDFNSERHSRYHGFRLVLTHL